jgi:hypothetical protein
MPLTLGKDRTQIVGRAADSVSAARLIFVGSARLRDVDKPSDARP